MFAFWEGIYDKKNNFDLQHALLFTVSNLLFTHVRLITPYVGS